MPKRVTGIGGIFFKCADPAATRDWYNKHLDINAQQWGATFEWRHEDDPNKKGQSVWNAFPATTKYFEPSGKEFMMNLRVENLEWLVGELKKEGVELVGELQDTEYGKFAHIVDPNGIKIELWEAKDEVEETK